MFDVGEDFVSRRMRFRMCQYVINGTTLGRHLEVFFAKQLLDSVGSQWRRKFLFSNDSYLAHGVIGCQIIQLEEFLTPKGITQYRLAKDISVP